MILPTTSVGQLILDLPWGLKVVILLQLTVLRVRFSVGFYYWEGEGICDNPKIAPIPGPGVACFLCPFSWSNEWVCPVAPTMETQILLMVLLLSILDKVIVPFMNLHGFGSSSSRMKNQRGQGLSSFLPPLLETIVNSDCCINKGTKPWGFHPCQFMIYLFSKHPTEWVELGHLVLVSVCWNSRKGMYRHQQ